MAIAYVSLGIIAFLVLILISPLHVTVVYKEELLLKIRFLCFCFKLDPNKDNKDDNDKNEKRKKAIKSKKTNKRSILDIIKDNGIPSFVKMLKDLIVIVLKHIKRFITHIKADLVDINYVIVGEDASDTAIKYGAVSSFAYTFESLLYSNKLLKKSKVNIIPGFKYKESYLDLEFKAHVELFRILSCVFAVMFNVMKFVFKLKYQKNK